MSSNSAIHQEISLSIKTTETTQDDYIFNNSHSNFRNKNMDFISKKREKLFIYTTPVIKRKKEVTMPSTPRKTKKQFNSNQYLKKGRNLLELFESL